MAKQQTGRKLPAEYQETTPLLVMLAKGAGRAYRPWTNSLALAARRHSIVRFGPMHFGELLALIVFLLGLGACSLNGELRPERDASEAGEQPKSEVPRRKSSRERTRRRPRDDEPPQA